MITRWNLTDREQEVLNLLAVECLAPKEIAFRLGIASQTIHTHVAHARNKMGVSTAAQVTLLWQREVVANEQLEKEARQLASLLAYQHCPQCNGFGFVPKAVA